jgi:hypothetical protein
VKITSKLLIAVGVVALTIPAAALAHPGHDSHPGRDNHPGGANGHGHDPAVAYIFKGTYGGDGSTVNVTGGNNHARRAGLVGEDVQFDFSSAKITVADTNGDGTTDLSDVVAGDAVLVRAHLPKSDPGAQPFAARQLVDQTNSDDSGDGSGD